MFNFKMARARKRTPPLPHSSWNNIIHTYFTKKWKWWTANKSIKHEMFSLKIKGGLLLVWIPLSRSLMHIQVINYSYPNAMLHSQNVSPENLYVSPTHFPAFSPHTITLTRYFFWFGPARSISPSYVKHRKTLKLASPGIQC